MWTAFVDLLAGVLHTFRHNKLRSALSLLGMIIGAGSMVLLAGLLHGARDGMVMTHQWLSEESDVIEVENAPVPPQKIGHAQRSLDLEDNDLLTDQDSLGAPVPEPELFAWMKKARAGTEKLDVTVLGGTERSAALYRVQVERGRFIDREDMVRRSRVCVVGHDIWEKLLGSPEKLDGLWLQVAGVRWAVVGVLKRKPVLVGSSGPWSWDRRIVVPATAFQMSVRRSRQVDEIYLRVPHGLSDLWERVNADRKLVRSMLLRRHYGVENFKIDEDKGEKEQEGMIIMVINVLMLCTAALSLFAGGINIMNIMLVTVTERTREIGVRRALGATRGGILRQFLLESAIVAGLGGLLGVLGGVVLVFAASKGLSAWLGFWPAHYEVWAMALGLSCSTLTGVIFGLYPAWRAARLDPVEALRYE